MKTRGKLISLFLSMLLSLDPQEIKILHETFAWGNENSPFVCIYFLVSWDGWSTWKVSPLNSYYGWWGEGWELNYCRQIALGKASVTFNCITSVEKDNESFKPREPEHLGRAEG